jgi:hypothetical protein
MQMHPGLWYGDIAEFFYSGMTGLIGTLLDADGCSSRIRRTTAPAALGTLAGR